MHFLEILLKHLINFAEWFFTVIIVKYLIVHWIGEQVLRIFRRVFVKTEEEMIVWRYYRNKAALGKKRLKEGAVLGTPEVGVNKLDGSIISDGKPSKIT